MPNYTESFELQEDGTHSVYARAVDDFGNASEVVTDLYVLDTVKPTITATADASTRGAVTVVAADETSGVDTVEYRVAGSETWTAVEGELDESGTIVVSVAIDDAAAEVEFRVTDVAGNVSDSVQVAWDAVEDPVSPAPGTPTPAPGSGGQLPTTGGELQGLAIGLIGLLLVGAGGGFMLLQRRRAARLTDGA